MPKLSNFLKCSPICAFPKHAPSENTLLSRREKLSTCSFLMGRLFISSHIASWTDYSHSLSIPLNKQSGSPKAMASTRHPYADFMPFPSRRSTVHSTNGMVSCTQPLASTAGQKILMEGGNAAVRQLSRWPSCYELTLKVRTQQSRLVGIL